MEATKDYRTIAAAKQAQREARIPAEWRISRSLFEDRTNLMDIPETCGVLSNVECEITSKHDATALLEKIKAGVWSVEQVTVAFCKRAAIAQQLTNCLTEIFFDEAIARAKQLDADRAADPTKPLPPLYGLPVSLKDSFQVRGHDASTGLACYVDAPSDEHSAAAEMLLDLGAVLYCKTNLPQTIMTGDSHNNVFGRTLNPRNVTLTAGGSTGGEGALLALRGSVLGLGTDIGGSIRVPALCNGVVGFRPSVGLIPHARIRDVTVPGTDGVRSSVGPIATSVRDCALLLRSVMQAETWKYDSAAIPLPWAGAAPKARLRVGVVLDNGVLTPSPPIRRAMAQAVDRLRADGSVDLVPLQLPDVEALNMDHIAYMALSGAEYYLEQFARTGEPAIPSLEGCGLLGVPGTTLKGFFDLNVRRSHASRKYLDLFRDNSLDVILMPPSAHTAVALDSWRTICYTNIWNYLDFPAIVVPVGEVNEEDVADDIGHAKYGKGDAEVYSLYTGPEDYKDAPIAVQVVGYKYTDEALLGAVAHIDSIVNKKETS